MKSQAFCLVTFFTFLIAMNADQSIPSFLKFIGSYKYNTTDNVKITLKRYYSSHRITYNWIDAFAICKSVGMRLALIQTDDELNNLAAVGRKNTKLFVNGYNLTTVNEINYDANEVEKEPCYSLRRYRRGKLEVHSEKCNLEMNKFLCEWVEIVDSYEDYQLSESDNKVDVKATFFTYIGNFVVMSVFKVSPEFSQDTNDRVDNLPQNSGEFLWRNANNFNFGLAQSCG